MGDEILQLLLHTAGAITVTGIFVWYLVRRDAALGAEQAAEREQLRVIMDQHAQAMDRMVSYLQSRDAQSKEIASTGHAALIDVAREVQRLRESMQCRQQEKH